MSKWRKGQSGNPDGKAVTAALRMRANAPAYDDGGNEILETDQSGKRRKVKKLEVVADALLHKAMKGDVNAIQEVFNRLDGKVANVNVEIPVKPAEEMSHEELVSFIAGAIADRGTEEDSDLSRAKPAGNA